MKPCSKNRKRIAWLALDALDGKQAAVLRQHLELCEGCRGYWEEISNVTEGVASAAPDSKVEASELFHRSVAAKLRAVESRSIPDAVAAWFGGAMAGWRMALPAIAVLIIALFAVVALRNHPTSPLPEAPTAQIVPSSNSESDLAPTIANYQMVANQSLDKLSDLLTRQGNKSLPPAPVYTAASFAAATGAF